MDNEHFNQDDALDLLKELSIQDFLDVGLNQVAYIKRLESSNDEQSNIFAVHAADGSQISVKEGYDKAMAAIRVHDLYPVTLH